MSQPNGRNEYGDYCLQQEETHPKITESVQKVASLWRQIIMSSCVDLNINIGSVALNQGCGKMVPSHNHNPAGVSVLPGRKQPTKASANPGGKKPRLGCGIWGVGFPHPCPKWSSNSTSASFEKKITSDMTSF